MNAQELQVSPPSAWAHQPGRKKPRRELQAHGLFVLIFLTAFVFFAVLRYGGGYYLTAMIQRPLHPLHALLKPSGVIGQGLGVAGGILCFLTLLYPLRKRWRRLANWGTPRRWFHFHVYCGIAGPLFATLHTAFKFGGLASICYYAMMIVMASGFVGRFLFALLPRNQRGVLLSLQEIDAEILSLQRALAAAGLNAEHFRVHAFRQPGRPVRLGWLQVLQLWRRRRQELRHWHRRLTVSNLAAARRRSLLALLSRKFFLESSRLTLDLTARAFSLWHAFHLPFTYLMFLTLIIHVSLALLLGYTWIF
ncbi:MAG: hypothetical protein ONB48_06365 [candidate division KSB1 bacterium]|nr:hypothetical protein [candidate division KSB1 bacterium]MDZ7273164.1 hypothetical protein [candidate division KSB1 bacterium]MDZ7285266.1 hypothetical protein [candidate division KSB1 bacterium]MDZ7298298.1 hypothetical protein [candidate division KSB1 bacterium]MDZ7306621.1 hypothetical protein [candidate division KSB1 bacterium]